MREKNKKIYENIIYEITINSKVTEKFIADKYKLSERTIRRYFRELKINNKIELVINGKCREWKIL